MIYTNFYTDGVNFWSKSFASRRDAASALVVEDGGPAHIDKNWKHSVSVNPVLQIGSAAGALPSEDASMTLELDADEMCDEINQESGHDREHRESFSVPSHQAGRL